MCFYANLGRRFFKSNNVGGHFYADFQGFCPDFQQIKLLEIRLQPLHPQLQHHCLS